MLSIIIICPPSLTVSICLPTGQSKPLRQLLQNPALQDMLLSLDSSHHPDSTISATMQKPIFTEFADKCLKIVEPENNNVTDEDFHISDSE
jgi:hypothetical protein